MHEIVPEEANVVKLIHELYAYTPGGIGFTNIAHKLDSMNLKPKKAKAIPLQASQWFILSYLAEVC